jgi:hypothetical protein
MDEATAKRICAVDIQAFLGIPDQLLKILLNRLPEAKAIRIRPFLERRFIFPLCKGCRESRSEGSITAREIGGRFWIVRRAMAAEDTDPAPVQSEAYADEIVILLDQAVGVRDSA